MIRIKVVRASQLILGAVVVLLAVVLTVLVVKFVTSGDSQQVSLKWSEANEAAVEVAAAFSPASGDDPPPLSVSFDDSEILEDEHTDEVADGMKIEIISPDATSSIPAVASPRVLIYHTHTHEAYEQVSGDKYVETGTWRTADQSHSIVRIGEALTELLRQRGFEVVHDVTDHEPPKLGTAYVRSLKTLESYQDEAFDLYIDLHRDSYEKGSGVKTLSYHHLDLARLMMLIGNGDGFEEKPNYTENLKFAKQLTNQINKIVPGLCKDVLVKNGRYNQHIGTPAILIEVGHNKNTLEQALASMPYLADALTALLLAPPA